MSAGVDPYAALGISPGADQTEIHAAYRAAVRRTHPDAGGTAAAFEAVQEAYEALRDAPANKRAPRAGQSSGTGAPRPEAPPRGREGPSRSDGEASRRMEALLAESRRLEDEARQMAGLPPRHDASGAPTADSGDSVGAIVRDASDQLRKAAGPAARVLRNRLRRLL